MFIRKKLCADRAINRTFDRLSSGAKSPGTCANMPGDGPLVTVESQGVNVMDLTRRQTAMGGV